MKLNCIIDTCSCITLSNAEFQQRTLLEYFNSYAYLNYSAEVHLELRDHSEKNLPTFIHNKKRQLKVMKYSMNEYERRMMGRVLVSRKKNENKGEVDNFLVSADQIHYSKISSVVFITDDETAINGILSKWFDSFPVIKLWTSFEVVLYLYAEKVIPTRDIALDLIKEIISFTAPRPTERSPETTKKLTRILVAYNQRIDNIHNLLN